MGSVVVWMPLVAAAATGLASWIAWLTFCYRLAHRYGPSVLDQVGDVARSYRSGARRRTAPAPGPDAD